MWRRATSHTSQQPWPCSGEDPWFSSKGRIMGVGKAVLGSHGLSSIVWSENGPCCRTIAYFVGGLRGRIWFDILCLKLYQFERIIWWCLSVLEFVLESALQSVLLERKFYKKNHGLSEFSLGLPLGGGPDKIYGRPWNLIHSPPCRTPCRLYIHEVFFGPLGLHLCVWSELGRSPPFQPLRALTLQWSWALSLVWEVTP